MLHRPLRCWGLMVGWLVCAHHTHPIERFGYHTGWHHTNPPTPLPSPDRPPPPHATHPQPKPPAHQLASRAAQEARRHQPRVRQGHSKAQHNGQDQKKSRFKWRRAACRRAALTAGEVIVRLGRQLLWCCVLACCLRYCRIGCRRNGCPPRSRRLEPSAERPS